MSIKVSVVVPVYNPGRAIEPCIASLLGQTLPADQLEILFVDDGSTDGTAARLDEVAAEALNVRVIHIPPSGAPGRPRNVGIEEARGEYIHFVDADDVLTPRALELLTAFADAHRSDVTMGKYASASLDRSQVVFTHTRARASLEATPELITASWAPAKLFRTSMLREHGITFKEGWRWMEDQLFVLRAYLAARNVSIFADAPCYYFVRREDGGHLSAEVLDPEPHAEHLAEVFDVIEAAVPPGTFRDKLLRRFYRANVLSRFDERYLALDEDLRRRTFEALHRFATERVEPMQDAAFGGAAMVRARLLRAGDPAALLEFTKRVEAYDVWAEITQLRWRAGRLVIGVRAHLRHATTGEPMPYLVRDGQTWLDPDLVGGGELADADIGSTMGRISLLDPATGLEWLLPAPFAPAVTTLGEHPAGGRRARLSVGASVEFDPARVGPAGIPLADGAWSVIFRWSGMGTGWTAPLRSGQRALEQALPAVFGVPPRLAVPRLGPDGLELHVTAAGLGVEDWQAAGTRVARQGRSLAVELPVIAARDAGASSADIVLDAPGGRRSWSGEVRPHLGRMWLRSLEQGFAALPATTAEAPLRAQLGLPFDLAVDLGQARLLGRGGIRVTGATDVPRLEYARRRLAWNILNPIAASWASLRQAAVDAAVRLPSPLRRILVTSYRRVRGRLG